MHLYVLIATLGLSKVTPLFLRSIGLAVLDLVVEALIGRVTGPVAGHLEPRTAWLRL